LCDLAKSWGVELAQSRFFCAIKPGLVGESWLKVGFFCAIEPSLGFDLLLLLDFVQNLDYFSFLSFVKKNNYINSVF
jgi:hypothetical protein